MSCAAHISLVTNGSPSRASSCIDRASGNQGLRSCDCLKAAAGYKTRRLGFAFPRNRNAAHRAWEERPCRPDGPPARLPPAIISQDVANLNSKKLLLSVFREKILELSIGRIAAQSSAEEHEQNAQAHMNAFQVLKPASFRKLLCAQPFVNVFSYNRMQISYVF